LKERRRKKLHLKKIVIRKLRDRKPVQTALRMKTATMKVISQSL